MENPIAIARQLQIQGVIPHLDPLPENGGFVLTYGEGAARRTITVTADTVLDGQLGGGSPATWGAIAGLLADQPDLVDALAAKATAAQGTKADTALQPVSGAIGYPSAAGYGGSVTQLTSKATAVTLHKPCGRITTHAAALAAAAEVTFVVNNSFVADTDIVLVTLRSGGTANAYLVTVGAVGAGSFNITISNLSAGSLGQALVLNFAIIKAAIN